MFDSKEDPDHTDIRAFVSADCDFDGQVGVQPLHHVTVTLYRWVRWAETILKLVSWFPCRVPNPTMSRNQTGGTELIPMPHPTGAAQLSLPIILYSAVQCGGFLHHPLTRLCFRGDSS